MEYHRLGFCATSQLCYDRPPREPGERQGHPPVPGIGVIHNPHSRKNRKKPDWMASLGYIVGTEGTSVATECIEDVGGMMRLFREQEIDVLAINGGDGSNSVALSALIHEYGDQALPKIALLRGGTINIAANSCGIRGTPPGLMINLVHKYREGLPFETTWRDTLQVEGRYGFVFGNGFIHGFIEALDERGKSPWGATKLLGQLVGSAMVGGKLTKRMFAGVQTRVSVDGKELPLESVTAIAAATVEQIGLKFKAFHRWDERPHSFHLLVTVCSPMRFATALPKLYVGRKVTEEKMLELVASELNLISDLPLSYTLDGENYVGDRELTLTTGPRLEIIVQ